MDGDTAYTFKASPVTDFRIEVSATGVVAKTMPRNPKHAHYGKTWRVDFENVEAVAFKELKGTKLRSEGIDFKTRDGKSVSFGCAIGAIGGQAEQIRGYRLAAAAAMRAFADAYPTAAVRNGQSIGMRAFYAFAYIVIAAAAGALTVWLSGESGLFAYLTAAVVSGSILYTGYTRMRIGKTATFMDARAAAAYLAERTTAEV